MLNNVKDTGTAKGRGLFAWSSYDEGRVVEESPVITFESKLEELPIPIRQRVFDWDKSKSVYALALGYGSLINHANPANMRYVADPHRKVIYFIAARNIKMDEELTINYNSENGEAEWHDNNWFEKMGIQPL